MGEKKRARKLFPLTNRQLPQSENQFVQTRNCGVYTVFQITISPDEWLAIPKEPAAFKESAVEKKQPAVYGATYWSEWNGKSLLKFSWQIGRAKFQGQRRRNGVWDIEKEEGRKGAEKRP